MVFHDFQFEGAIKRMVHNGAHLWPIAPMPPLISIALHNLCPCANIRTLASRKTGHRVKYEPGLRSITFALSEIEKEKGLSSHQHHHHHHPTHLGVTSDISSSVFALLCVAL